MELLMALIGKYCCLMSQDPLVSACGNTITFPTQHMSSAEMFRKTFLLAYCKGQAFVSTSLGI